MRDAYFGVFIAVVMVSTLIALMAYFSVESEDEREAGLISQMCDDNRRAVAKISNIAPLMRDTEPWEVTEWIEEHCK